MSQDSIFEIQANLCHCMSNSVRVEIIHILRDGPLSVNGLVNRTGRSQPLISRHLGMLREGGIVTAQRQGHDVIYQIANPKIVSICNLLQEVLMEEASRRSKLMDAIENESSE